MKTFDKSQEKLEAELADYLSGEQSAAAWQFLEIALIDPNSTLTESQKDLLNGLRRDELLLQADSRLLEDYQADAPDPATLRTMVRGWQQTRVRRRVSNLARWGLSASAGMACLILVVSLVFSLNGAAPGPTTNPERTAGVGVAAVPTPTATVKVINWPVGVQISLLYPVRGRNSLISQFGDWVDGKENDGIDIAAVAGSPIIAAEKGTVVSAGWQDDKAGNTIVIDHGNTIFTRYSHLASVGVVPGQVVTKGQQIGIIGTTGDAVGIHLHFEMIVGGLDGRNVDPLFYIFNFLEGVRYDQPTPTPLP